MQIDEYISEAKDDFQKLNQIIDFCRANYNITHKKTFQLAETGLNICKKLNLVSEENILKTYQAFFFWHNNEVKKAISIINSISAFLLTEKNLP